MPRAAVQRRSRSARRASRTSRRRGAKGEPRIVDDFRFHAQNVYALVMKTLARFEFALGRRVGWSFGTHQLKVAPHGMLDANAFYSPRRGRARLRLLRGPRAATTSTPASRTTSSCTRPRTRCSTRCASATSTRPARTRPRSTRASPTSSRSCRSSRSRSWSRSSWRRQRSATAAALIDERRRRRSTRCSKSALFGLAEQMGQEMQGVRGGALRRSARARRRPEARSTIPSSRSRTGEARSSWPRCMNGFIDAWAARIAGPRRARASSRYAVARVAEEGADIADDAGHDVDPRARLHAAGPPRVRRRAERRLDRGHRGAARRLALRAARAHAARRSRPTASSPPRRAPTQPGAWEHAPGGLSYDRVRFESMRSDKDEVFRFLWENRKRARAARRAPTREVLSVRPCVRVGPGRLHAARDRRRVLPGRPPDARGARAQKGITLPKDYVGGARRSASRAAERQAQGRRAPRTRCAPDGDDGRPRRGRRRRAGHDPDLRRRRARSSTSTAGSSTTSTTTSSARRQTGALEYLWEAGQLEPGARRRAAVAPRACRPCTGCARSTRGAFPRRAGEPWPRRPSRSRSARYQVGFGDCFLLSFVYSATDKRHVLIDFGTTELPTRGTPRKAAKPPSTCRRSRATSRSVRRQASPPWSPRTATPTTSAASAPTAGRGKSGRDHQGAEARRSCCSRGPRIPRPRRTPRTATADSQPLAQELRRGPGRHARYRARPSSQLARQPPRVDEPRAPEGARASSAWTTSRTSPRSRT